MHDMWDIDIQSAFFRLNNWNQSEPPDDLEIARNRVIRQIQGIGNLYVEQK
jgi:endonuclease I